MTLDTVLIAKNLSKVFLGPHPIEILKSVDLEVNRGEVIAITGRSGSGKSTLLNILGTLETATSGSISLCGYDTANTSPTLLRNKHIGFIFQAFHLLEDFSLIDNILMPAKIASYPTSKQSAAYQRALELMGIMGLSCSAHQITKNLSGGEKQRVCLARALCNQPDLILADEPTGNLDRVNAELVSSLLITTAKKEKKSIILVTHDEDLAALCDKTFHLKDGFLHRIR
jgi:lipoprotein-releasing system ATP-binding protein